MPHTLQDAIRVTQGLGLLHLWIDALCIIQDSAEDKAVEVSRMSMIYSGAAITIAGSRGRSVEEGFPQDRLPAGSAEPQNTFRLTYHCSNSAIGSVVVVSQPPIKELKANAWRLESGPFKSDFFHRGCSSFRNSRQGGRVEAVHTSRRLTIGQKSARGHLGEKTIYTTAFRIY
jgi:hypothetical protein